MIRQGRFFYIAAAIILALIGRDVLAARYDPQKADTEFDARIQRLEALVQNEGVVELLQRVEQLQLEMQELRGTIEQLRNDVDGMQKRQRSMYLDIDRRLNDLQLNGGSPAPLGSLAVTPEESAVHADIGKKSPENLEQERLAYEAAFKYLREGRYPQAIDAFTQFLKQYPDGRYSGNSQYWLGEANYVSRHFEQALIEFLKVLDKYSNSSKLPDTKLKLGYTYYELKQWDRARQMLNDVLKNYPTSSVAPLAEKRLIRMTEEGH